MRSICRLYASAKELYAQGINLVSVDEKPGIQAIERDGTTLPAKPGSVERREFNYIRHGTQVLTSNIHLATGKILTPTIADTRTEPEFVAHIDQLVQTDPSASWVILLDQLNTHKSASLVEYVANVIGDGQDLGVKDRTGILKNVQSRMEYLQNNEHQIRFVYTPKHCSWLNCIEVWFSILTTHVLKRGNFVSTQDLKQKIENYIDYYNKHLARAWSWSVVKTKDITRLIERVQCIEQTTPTEASAICLGI